MKTTTTKIITKEFEGDNLFVELEKVIEFKHPFTLSSDKQCSGKYRLEYMTTEVVDDSSND